MTDDQTLFGALLEAAPDAMVIVDEGGVIQLVNAQAEALFGYPRHEMLGNTIELLVPPRVRNAHEHHRLRYSEAAHTRPMGAGLSLHGRRRDGSEFPVEISLSPLHTRDRRFTISAVRDITDRKRIEEERHRLLRERAAHQEASRIKDEFIATISHELRTPLNAILGWATLLEGGGLPPDTVTRGLSTIRRNAKTQAQLIEDLLDVSRIVTGKLQLRRELVDLAGVLEGAIEVMKPAAAGKRVSLEVTIEVRPLLIHGDADRLQQAIWNVLSNAIKFTDARGRVSVTLRAAQDSAVLTVRDTGHGIPPEFMPFLFDRFRQADSSYARQYGGLGLGLAIVKSIVELHGGSVTGSSSGPGLGATFQIRLPQTQVVSSAAPRPLKLDDTFPQLSGIRVLVVDDQTDERDLMHAMLGSLRAQVTTADSADAAMEAMGSGSFDVVISDLAMPIKDGYYLVRTLAREFPHVPVMALTAHARSEDQERALSAGFRLYLSKPVEPIQLASAVAALVGSSTKLS